MWALHSGAAGRTVQLLELGGAVDDGGRFTMFRRAKRMLEDVPTEVLEAAAARPVDQYACRRRPGLVERWVTTAATAPSASFRIMGLTTPAADAGSCIQAY